MSAKWDVEYTDEFGTWWDTLSLREQESIDTSVRLLEEKGPALGFPYTSGVKGSRHSRMRELRVQHAGRPFRILFAFDPRRCAVLLLGGDKGGNGRWYSNHVVRADALFDMHLEIIQREGAKHDQEVQ